MSASARQRREKILACIRQNSQVSVKALAASLVASEPTIRRDLRALAAQGHVMLVYGGATLTPEKDNSFRSRSQQNIEAKKTIGRLAAGFVKDGDTILLDSGSTTASMLPFLKSSRGLTIITHSARLALEIEVPTASVILIGGAYRQHLMDTVGPLAAANFEHLRGYTAFIGASGMDKEFGLTATEAESAHINSLTVRNAARTILLVDYTKFTKSCVFKVAGFESISAVVCDQPPPPDWRDFFASRGIPVVSPSSPQHTL
jgi:DeoR/GlpR family transcriptional regulator of sugar metabolism